MELLEMYEKIIYVYDIDVDNCRMTHNDWARLLSRAIKYPDEFKEDIDGDYKILREERNDWLTRGNI
jgi:hypothetical protein